MREWKPKVGDLLGCRTTYDDRYIVIGETHTGNNMYQTQWFELLNVQSGETTKHRHDFDWWNWYEQEQACV